MLGTVVRFIVSAVVLQLTAFLVPGFSVGGFLGALVTAVVIALIAWLIEGLFKISPRSRGVIGFLVSAITIYLAQFVVGTVSASVIGALLAAFVIGIIDAFIPIEVR